uniref:ARAD1B12452p n=1 Tax=Blastobotrys adeninivorans TaxID=409370 RepID=A0A060T6I5_BLAAD
MTVREVRDDTDLGELNNQMCLQPCVVEMFNHDENTNEEHDEDREFTNAMEKFSEEYTQFEFYKADIVTVCDVLSLTDFESFPRHFVVLVENGEVREIVKDLSPENIEKKLKELGGDF